MTGDGALKPSGRIYHKLITDSLPIVSQKEEKLSFSALEHPEHSRSEILLNESLPNLIDFKAMKLYHKKTVDYVPKKQENDGSHFHSKEVHKIYFLEEREGRFEYLV